MPKRSVFKWKSSAGKVKKSKKEAEGCISEQPPDALNEFMKIILKFSSPKKDGYNWLAHPFTNVGLYRMYNKTIGCDVDNNTRTPHPKDDEVCKKSIVCHNKFKEYMTHVYKVRWMNKKDIEEQLHTHPSFFYADNSLDSFQAFCKKRTFILMDEGDFSSAKCSNEADFSVKEDLWGAIDRLPPQDWKYHNGITYSPLEGTSMSTAIGSLVSDGVVNTRCNKVAKDKLKRIQGSALIDNFEKICFSKIYHACRQKSGTCIQEYSKKLHTCNSAKRCHEVKVTVMKGRSGQPFQEPHVDFDKQQLAGGKKTKTFVGIAPITRDGCYIQVWDRDDSQPKKKGYVIFIPFGKMLIFPSYVIHGGGFLSKSHVNYNYRLQFYFYLEGGMDPNNKNRYIDQFISENNRKTYRDLGYTNAPCLNDKAWTKKLFDNK